MSVNSNEMQTFLNNLTNFQSDIDKIIESCAKELVARFLAKVIKRTPVGDYSKIKTFTAKRTSANRQKGETYTRRVAGSRHGGTLRRGWSTNNMTIARSGTLYSVTVINPTPYASYVEYGHRTRGGRGWVQGRFMMTISAQEIQRSAQVILEKKIQTELERYFNDR